MASRSRPRANKTGRQRRRGHRIQLKTASRLARSWWGAGRVLLQTWLASPPTVRLLVGATLLLIGCWGINWVYHAIHKPSELFFPLDGALNKSPQQTWRQYGELFREHSTAVMTPELLAALAQVEGAGNPVARTYWRWRQTWNPFELYQPASSAVGMYQITDGTFRQAKRYCIHNHVVVEEGPWHDRRSCWFNGLYTRVLPSHAIELTAALLDRTVTGAIGPRQSAVTLKQKQDLAALIHLCGAGAGRAYATAGFRLIPRQRCGDHDIKSYLARVNAMKQQFARLAAGGTPDRFVSSPMSR